jgi:hypothetical protein
MKRSNLFLMIALTFALALSGCTVRLVDFTVISTKNAEIGVDRSKGVQTEGKKGYFLGIGFNLKDALDIALENAGPQYDILIDGVVSYQNLPFVNVVKVKGVAVSSQDLRTSLGQEGYEHWCKTHNVFNPKEEDVSGR